MTGDGRALAGLAGRLAAATPEPWRASFEGRDHTSGDRVILTPDGEMYIAADDYAGGGGHFRADLDFIACARQDLPRRVAALRERRRAGSR